MKRVTLVRPERKHPVYVKKPVEAEPSKPTVESLLALADQLTPSQRKEVLARLSLAAQVLPVEQTRDVDMWAGAVQSALETLAGGQGEGSQGLMVIKRSVGSPAAWGPVQSFMKTSRLDSLKVTERQSVYTMLAKLVTENAKSVARHVGIPLTPKLVASCAANITGIFNQSFPGYLESGLALMVARRLTAG